MKLTIFGATGGTGRLLVDRALAAGHDVVVYARNPDKLGIKHERLSVIAGGLMDAGAIRRAVQDTDAVLSALGPPFRPESRPLPMTEGIGNALAAMKELDVGRIIVTSTLSVPDPSDRLDFKTRLMRAIARNLVPAAYKDILGVAATVRASDRDWTLVRITTLNDKPADGKIALGYVGEGVKMSVSRGNLADFMLHELSEGRWNKKAPAISDA